MSINLPDHWITAFDVIDRTLVVRFAKPRKVIASAVHGGGIAWANAIMNHQVLPHPHSPGCVKGPSRRWEDPSRTLRKIANGLGIVGRSVGLMTAVDLRQLVVMRECAEGIWIEGLFTVGVTNAVRAGEPTSSNLNDPGTINIILVTNAKLDAPALVGAIGVATESKTAVLLEHHIPSYSGSGKATGTGTDAMVMAIGDGPRLRYSGTHTKFGELLGCVVARGVAEGLSRIRDPRVASKDRDHS